MDLSIMEKILRAAMEREALEAKGHRFPKTRDMANQILNGPCGTSNIPKPKSGDDVVTVAKEIGHKCGPKPTKDGSLGMGRRPTYRSGITAWGAE